LNIERDHVHLWRASSSVSMAETNRFAQTLSRGEREQAGRFATPVQWRRFVVRRGVLRSILSRYLGIRPEELELEASASGKPALVPDGPLRFNTAATGDLAVVSVAQDREVGVDVERIRPAAVHDVADRFFAVQEIEALRRLSPPARDRLFFRLWARKEALSKATGEGLGTALRALEVPLAPDRSRACVTVDGERWSIQDLAFADGYVGAVAAAGPAFRVVGFSAEDAPRWSADGVPGATWVGG
jgi:4'-phosphopantetheinyl transferase